MDKETIVKKTTTSNIDTPFGKELKKDFFSADDVLDAYFQGKNDGIKNYSEELLTLIKRNVRDTSRFTFEVSEFLFQKGVSPSNSYIRLTSKYSVDVLLTISEDEYLNEDFIEVYDIVGSLEDEYNSEDLNIHLSFVPKNESFREEVILSDGYILNTNFHETSTRKTQ